MRWFKHYTDSLDDPFIQELIRKFGSQGYLAWFGLIEIICAENGKDLTGEIEVSPVFLKQKFHISSRKLQEIFEFCSRKVKLFSNFSSENWKFSMPKILEIKDNYTKDLQATCKRLAYQSKSKSKSKNKEGIAASKKVKKTAEKKDLYTALFNKFWDEYPKKRRVNKQKSLDIWVKKVKPDNGLFEQIMTALKNHNTHWEDCDPRYIPHATTWLNGKRWEDEIEAKAPPKHKYL